MKRGWLSLRRDISSFLTERKKEAGGEVDVQRLQQGDEVVPK